MLLDVELPVLDRVGVAVGACAEDEAGSRQAPT